MLGSWEPVKPGSEYSLLFSDFFDYISLIHEGKDEP
jgi:hypothetical protein